MPAIPVAGQVVDAQGNPVGGAAVMLGAGPGPVPDVAQLTGSDGAFELAVSVPGRYRVVVQGPGGERAEEDVEVDETTSPSARIVLNPPGR